MAVTSLTPSSTGRFKNEHRFFIYRHIRAGTFCGHTLEKHDGYPVLIAGPEDALVDWLYFNHRQTSPKDRTALRPLFFVDS